MSAVPTVFVHKSFASFLVGYKQTLTVFYNEMSEKLPAEDCAAFRRMLAHIVAEWETDALPPRARGERHHLAILTEKDVTEIRSKYGPGTTVRMLAEQYGVAPATIHKVVASKSWKHLISSKGAK